MPLKKFSVSQSLGYVKLRTFRSCDRCCFSYNFDEHFSPAHLQFAASSPFSILTASSLCIFSAYFSPMFS